MEEPAGPRGTKGSLSTRPVCASRSETVVERMLSNWMSICLYQYLKVGSTWPSQVWGRGEVVLSSKGPPAHAAPPGGPSPTWTRLHPTLGWLVLPMAEPPMSFQDSAGEPLYKLFKAIKHQVEKGPVDAVQKKAKYTLNDTGLLGDDVEYAPLVSPRAGWATGGPQRLGCWPASGSGAGRQSPPLWTCVRSRCLCWACPHLGKGPGRGSEQLSGP